MKELCAEQFREYLLSGKYNGERYEVKGHLNLADLVKKGQLQEIVGCIFHDLDLVDQDNNTGNSNEQEERGFCLKSLRDFVSHIGLFAVSCLPHPSSRVGTAVGLMPHISFERCVFRKPLSLSQTRFNHPVFFKECRFNGYVNLAKSHFSGLSFHDCSFDEKVYCEETCFDSWAQTSVAKNDSDIDFSEVTFNDGADFERSFFRGKATFAKAVFYEATTFTGVRFCKGSSGNKPDAIQNMLSLNSAQIFGFVGFRAGANDSQKKDPSGSQQNGVLNAKEDKNGKRLGKDCCDCDRSDGENLRVFEHMSNKGLEIDFRNIYVQSDRGLRFHSANLESCKLVGTNLDVCYFNNVRWPEVRSHVSILALKARMRSSVWTQIIGPLV